MLLTWELDEALEDATPEAVNRIARELAEVRVAMDVDGDAEALAIAEALRSFLADVADAKRTEQVN